MKIKEITEGDVIQFPTKKAKPEHDQWGPELNSETGEPMYPDISDQLEYSLHDTTTGKQISVHSSEEEANVAQRKQLKWHGIEIEILIGMQ